MVQAGLERGVTVGRVFVSASEWARRETPFLRTVSTDWWGKETAR
jgi:hypothetical protein